MNSKSKKYQVKAQCTAVFYIEIEAKNQKEADAIAKTIELSGDYDTSDFNFDGNLEVEQVTEIS